MTTKLQTALLAIIPFLVLLTNSASACYTEFDSLEYSDEHVAELITVITATSPVLCIPNTTHIYPSQVSLHRNSTLARAKKIIVFDGVAPGEEYLEAAYNKYKQNIQDLVATDPYFANTELVFCSQWGHLSGSIQEALEHVTTPFIFMHQHDLVLKKDFNINALIATMIANPAIKYVHLWGGKNKKSKWWNRTVDDKVEGVHFVPLTRSFGWSDQCHVASVDYYKNEVLPECDHCFMETVMQQNFEKAFKEKGKKAHEQFGTYLYGGLSDGHYIKHTDGRNNP